ncbi:MAG: glutamate 5-kinase [Beijerinckiaceae bacterium]
MTLSLASFKRIVVKVGSSLLVDPAKGPKTEWLNALADDLAALHKRGADVLVVSSGAIALGRTVMGYPKGALTLDRSQAAAAVGQIALARIWSEALGNHAITAGQILITLQDTEERRRYLNARATLDELLAQRAVPVINENDTVATVEIRYGDNDRLAARVATMAGADLLILLSDIDGLYTAPPHTHPDATLIPVVPRITAEIEAMAGGAASELSRGGMTTKIEAAKIAVAGGAHMIIANGKRMNPVRAIAEGQACTWFLTPSDPVSARKRWIGGSLDIKGTITVDDGAAVALKAGKSLLPAGIRQIDGDFERGDAVLVRTVGGVEIARGLAGYDVQEARAILGANSRDIARILGYAGRSAMVHTDDMVLIGEGSDKGTWF